MYRAVSASWDKTAKTKLKYPGNVAGAEDWAEGTGWVGRLELI